MKKILILSLLLTVMQLTATPWGRDADLVHSPASCEPPQQRCRTALFGAIAEAGIRFHQEVISPADGPRSHFHPSSSTYTLEAMRCHGFFRGFLLGCDRLMRENPDPWIYRKCSDGMKYDPIPQKY